MKDFSGASSRLFFVLIMCSCSISWNMCSLESDKSNISSMQTRAKPCSMRVLKKVDICFVKKFGSPFETIEASDESEEFIS